MLPMACRPISTGSSTGNSACPTVNHATPSALQRAFTRSPIRSRRRKTLSAGSRPRPMIRSLFAIQPANVFFQAAIALISFQGSIYAPNTIPHGLPREGASPKLISCKKRLSIPFLIFCFRERQHRDYSRIDSIAC